MIKPLRAALYVRVSTTDKGQTTENQLRELNALAAQRGWEVINTYQDMISGAKGRDKRPGVDAMLKDATRGKFDVLLVWSVDRLGRSLQDLVGFLDALQRAKVDLVMLQQAVDTTTPAGRALFGMLGVFSEFERSMIQARVQSGMDRAREEQARGPRYDRNGHRKQAIGRPSVNPVIRAQVLEMLQAGQPMRSIGDEVGISVGAVFNIKRETQSTITID